MIKSIHMKRYYGLLFLIFISFGILAQTQDAPKVRYAFLFIGDGMGLAQVNLTQAYLAAKDSADGWLILCLKIDHNGTVLDVTKKEESTIINQNISSEVIDKIKGHR